MEVEPSQTGIRLQSVISRLGSRCRRSSWQKHGETVNWVGIFEICWEILGDEQGAVRERVKEVCAGECVDLSVSN